MTHKLMAAYLGAVLAVSLVGCGGAEVDSRDPAMPEKQIEAPVAKESFQGVERGQGTPGVSASTSGKCNENSGSAGDSNVYAACSRSWEAADSWCAFNGGGWVASYGSCSGHCYTNGLCVAHTYDCCAS